MVLPTRYALLPLGFLFGRSIITTILQLRSPSSKPFQPDIIHGYATAQLPLPSSSPSPNNLIPQANFGTTAASSSIVAFHLGIYINHPLGILAPGGKDIGGHFDAMLKELLANRTEFGLVNWSNWRGTTRASNNCILLIAYFRSAEDLNRFAHSKVHRDGLNWYNNYVRETGHHHFGIFHETFVSRRGEWETIYVDCEPTLLGGGNVQVGGGEGGEKKESEEVWVRPLVSARHPALRTQAKRLSALLGLKDEVV